MRDPLTARVRATPGALAMVEAANGVEHTYRDLDSAVEKTAGRLAALGVTAGDHLGVCLHTSTAFVRLIHAAARLGAVLVPLNAEHTPTELTPQVELAELVAVVTDDSTHETVAAATESVPAITLAELEDTSPGDVEPAEWALDDPQLLLFTSGTTGQSKAVVLTAGNVLASARASAFRLGVLPDDRWHCCLPMYHMGGLAPVIRSTLYGTAVVVEDQTERGFDAECTRRLLTEHGATGVSIVPTMLSRLLDAGPLPDSLRFVLTGGAPTPDDLVERCGDRDVPICPTYGMTETASQIATARPGEATAHVGTVGKPLVWTEVTVVGEDGTPQPFGETGELAVSGPTVMAGYYGDPDATESAFSEHGLLTGDVGYRDDDGRLYVLNRVDDRIITGGENVEPGEVVDVLESHPAVEAAAVVGLDDPEWGERVAALVVPAGQPTVADLLEFCRDRLASYKVPKTIAFAPELPRTASGTVERAAVRERLEGRE